MNRKFEIADKKRYQHYKDRTPPWVKLHNDILMSREWVMLDDASRLLAIVCILLASRCNGVIEEDPDYIQKMLHLENRPDFQPLLDVGFLVEHCNQVDMLAPCTQPASDRKQTLVQSRVEERRIEKSRVDNFPTSPPPPTASLFPEPQQAVVVKTERKAPKPSKPEPENPGLSNADKKWFVEQWQTQYPGKDPAWEHDKLTWIRMYARLKNFSLEEIRSRWTLYLGKTGSYFDGHSFRTFLDRDFDKALESANGNGFRSSSKYGGDENPPGWKPTIYGKPADPDIPLAQQRFD